ncbi:MAG: aminopeptidase N, partial [Spirochaetales bacterium]|nr:aminopeptidase N [Spirochaetales bacterium]
MKEIHLSNYTKPEYVIPQTNLYVTILENEVYIDSTLEIEHNTNGNMPLVLNGKNLVIESISIDNNLITDYLYKDDLLTISDVPSKFIFRSRVKIDPYNNKSLAGFYKSGDILCTQNEAEGFRNITFFMDRPDVMSKYTITIEGDKSKYPYLLANGNLIESKELPNNRHSKKWVDPFAKPSYLVAMVAGNLELVTDKFKTKSGRDVTLEIYTDPGKSIQAAHAMTSLKDSMKWDEEVFGLEYDLDIYMIVAVDSFNFGAMENKGLNIFNSVYVLADPETATDSDFEGVQGVIGHEYFHNWTGNRVTCRDWFQLTLKEGLTVFRDQEFSSDMTDRTVKRINDVAILRNSQFTEDKGPNSHPIKPKSYIEIDNFYTATVYEKGAEVIRMIHTLIGKENFRKGIDLYFKRHDGTAVTTEDFVQAMSDASGHNLEQFKLWYSQAGTPVVNVNSDYSNGIFTLKVKQSIPKTAYNGGQEPQYFPLKISLIDKDGESILNENESVLIISKEYEEFTFKTDREVIPSLNQGFSAPVIVEYNYSVNDLITLLKYDNDNFNRYDAARRLSIISINNILNGKTISKEVIESYKVILKENNLEKRYLSTLLHIPTVKEIVSTMETYDFIKAGKARKTYAKSLAESLKGELFRLFEDNVRDSYLLNKTAVAERALKNKSLFILSFLGDDIEEIALKQFRTSNNMTDYLAAFSTLQNCSDKSREMANKEFYEKWNKNFLVMNKWFAVQALRDNENVLKEIEILSNHPNFDKTNPNSLRSLYGSFAGGNLGNFHAIDGSGYKFIKNKIVE